MNEALHQAYLSAQDRLDGLTFAEFARALSKAEVHPVNVDGECVGALIVDGPEIHACVNGCKGLWVTRREVRILNGVIAKHGYAVTTATTSEGRQFVQRLGFKPFGGKWIKETPYGH